MSPCPSFLCHDEFLLWVLIFVAHIFFLNCLYSWLVLLYADCLGYWTVMIICTFIAGLNILATAVLIITCLWLLSASFPSYLLKCPCCLSYDCLDLCCLLCYTCYFIDFVAYNMGLNAGCPASFPLNFSNCPCYLLFLWFFSIVPVMSWYMYVACCCYTELWYYTCCLAGKVL